MAYISKRGDRWQYVVHYKDLNGKYKRISKSGFDRKKDAQDAASELERKIKEGVSVESSPTFIDYYNHWLEVYKLGKHSRITESRYKTIAKQLEAYFGKNQQLKTIKRSDWQEFLNFFSKNHAKDTVSKLNSYVRDMANSAIADRLIYFNFTDGAIISGAKGKSEDLKYLQVDDYRKLKKYVLENASLDNIFDCIISAGVLTGARLSEVLALTWKDLDLKNQTLSINKSWDYTYTNSFKPTKTPSSIRTIDIDKDLTNLFKKLKKEQKNYFKSIGRKWSENTLAFLDRELKLISNVAINKDLRHIEKKLNISPLITFHGLRHTHVSYLLYKDVDINYISKRLGHASTSITLKIYTHLLKDEEKRESNKAIKAMEDL